MDFLLECIGFPPDHDFEALATLARRAGEPAPWRGPPGDHVRMPLGEGLELRMDREQGESHWSLYPFYRSQHRLRIGVQFLLSPPDSPFDAMLSGWANPPVEGDWGSGEETFPLSCILADARRLPREIEVGHVLAVSLAGFALDVEDIGPAEVQREVRGFEVIGGGWIGPLGGLESPGGCVELCLPIASVRTLDNPVTHAPVTRLEVELPSRRVPFFVSPWQLEADGLPPPRVGWRIAGTFLLTGRIAGGLASPTERLGSRFG